jgi:Zn-dependent protease
MPTTATLLNIASWVLPLIFAITLHEVAHGLVANIFGDHTARDLGRLSLNPIRHVDPVGTLVLPMMLAIGGAPVFGWAKPVPVMFSALRNPRWHGVLVSAAGPMMNFALALLSALTLGLIYAVEGPVAGPIGSFVRLNLFNFVLVNVSLGVFNLIPVPPLDGGGVVSGLLPPALGRRYASFGKYGLVLLLVVLVGLPWIFPKLDLLPRLIGPPVQAMVNGLLGLAGLA